MLFYLFVCFPSCILPLFDNLSYSFQTFLCFCIILPILPLFPPLPLFIVLYFSVYFFLPIPFSFSPPPPYLFNTLLIFNPPPHFLAVSPTILSPLARSFYPSSSLYHSLLLPREFRSTRAFGHDTRALPVMT